jgi:hypothetical protein
MSSTLEQRIEFVKKKSAEETTKKLQAIEEIFRLEEYLREQRLSYFTYNDLSSVSIDLGIFDRDPGPARERVVNQLRAIRKHLGTPLKLVSSDVSYRHPNAKQDSYVGGVNKSVHVKTHITLREGDPCRIVTEYPEGASYQTLVCGI